VVLAAALGADTASLAATQSPQPLLRLVTETAMPASRVSAQELHDIAVDAYVYAYPLVMMEMARRAATNVAAPVDGRAPVNQFGHRTAFPTAGMDKAAWPNTDTLYSSLWFDVVAEPLIVQIPDAGERYYTLSMLDMWTDVFDSRGPRTSGRGAQTFAIVGPSWQGVLPAGVSAVRSPTAQGWLIGQVQTAGPADYAAVNQFQAGMRAAPLGLWDKPYALGAAGVVNPMWDTTTAPVALVAGMDAAAFFNVFAEVQSRNPAHANDNPMRERLHRVGLGGPQPFYFSRLDPAVQQALVDARPEAGRRIADNVARLSQDSNGWSMVLNGIGTYGTDYARRAAVAYVGLGANKPEDVIYPVTAIDAKGEALRAERRYVLHFDKAQLPPVDAFWSLILYDDGHAFAANPEQRYAVRSTDPLRYNADGSLDLIVQRKNPGVELAANWLPAPDEGPFMLNMRLYWPKNAALDGNWAPPAVRSR